VWFSVLLALLIPMAILAGVSDARRARSRSSDEANSRLGRRWARRRGDEKSNRLGISILSRTVGLSEDDAERINTAIERDGWTTKPAKASRRSR
jgi:hypothetical protein